MPYLWAAGFTGTIGTPSGGTGIPGGGQIEATFGDLLGNLELDGGGMIAVEYRRDRWSVFGDWTYAKVRSEAPSPFGELFSGVEGELKGHIVQGAAGYRVYRGEKWGVDLFGGARHYDLDLRMELRPGQLAAQASSVKAAWTDGIAGFRCRRLFGDRWVLELLGDAGTGGSDFSWQGVASVGYRYSWGELTGGWRHLKVDYEKDETVADLSLSGPFFGAAFRF